LNSKIFFTEEKMKKSQYLKIAVVSIIGAVSCLLWLPLLPLIAPLVIIALVIKWASRSALNDLKQPLVPFTPFSQSQAQDMNAWPSLASLPYPAGAGSLPFSSKMVKEKKVKRVRREARQIARVLKGLELRKAAINL
jgi:hypothetical protein